MFNPLGVSHDYRLCLDSRQARRVGEPDLENEALNMALSQRQARDGSINNAFMSAIS